MDFEPYKKSIGVILGGLGLTVLALLGISQFKLFEQRMGIIPLPVNMFSFWYLSKSPLPYLYGCIAITSVVMVVNRQGERNEKSPKWMSHPYKKLFLGSLNYLAVGITEELERWCFVFFYALSLNIFSHFLYQLNWESILAVSVLIVTIVSFLGHSKRDFFGGLLLVLHLGIFAFLILFFGLYTAMVIHVGVDLSIAIAEFWMRVRRRLTLGNRRSIL